MKRLLATAVAAILLLAACDGAGDTETSGTVAAVLVGLDYSDRSPEGFSSSA